jgi:hypothetical protein
MYGIVLTPLIYPDESDVGEKILSLVATCRPPRTPRLFECAFVSSLARTVLEDLGAKASARQAVMVKHLARW